MSRILTSILLIAILSLQTTCKSKDDTLTNNLSDSSNPGLIAQIKRSPCFGTCPVDLVQIYADRTVKYKGIKHTDITGTYTAVVSSTQKDSLSALIDKIESLDSNKTKYVMEHVMDLPSRTITIEDRKITYQLSEAPDEIVELDKFIYDLISELDFTKAKEITN